MDTTIHSATADGAEAPELLARNIRVGARIWAAGQAFFFIAFLFAFFGAVYYWLPKMLGVTLNERLGKIHFWLFFIFFNLTFFPMFAAGFLDMPRRVSTYAPHLQTLNIFISSSAYVIGISMLVFVWNLIWSLVFVRQPAVENPWASRGLEWQVPTPVPVDNFARIPVITSGPYEYGVAGAPPVADLVPSALPAAGS